MQQSVDRLMKLHIFFTGQIYPSQKTVVQLFWFILVSLGIEQEAYNFDGMFF